MRRQMPDGSYKDCGPRRVISDAGSIRGTSRVKGRSGVIRGKSVIAEEPLTEKDFKVRPRLHERYEPPLPDIIG